LLRDFRPKEDVISPAHGRVNIDIRRRHVEVSGEDCVATGYKSAAPSAIETLGSAQLAIDHTVPPA
jgi:hypothetical protein